MDEYRNKTVCYTNHLSLREHPEIMNALSFPSPTVPPIVTQSINNKFIKKMTLGQDPPLEGMFTMHSTSDATITLLNATI